MKSILIALTLILNALYGCGVQHHQKKIKKHTEKLKSKGVLIPKDTLYITKSDTVTAYYMRNDTVVEQITIRDTVYFEPTVEFKTKWQTRYETKWKYKYKTKYIKQQAKVQKVEARSNRKGVSWWWFILLILAFFVYLRLTK